MALNRELLEKYAKLKVDKKRIDAQIEFLNPAVLKEVAAVYEGQPVTTEDLKDIGSFSITKKKTWINFSPELESLKKQVAELEAKEKAEGPAEFEETETVVFNVVKEKKPDA